MTTLKEVELALLHFINSELAKEWVKNDIVKMKIASGYDDWMNDVNDHHCPLTLEEYIETCLDNPSYIGFN